MRNVLQLWFPSVCSRCLLSGSLTYFFRIDEKALLWCAFAPTTILRFINLAYNLDAISRDYRSLSLCRLRDTFEDWVLNLFSLHHWPHWNRYRNDPNERVLRILNLVVPWLFQLSVCCRRCEITESRSPWGDNWHREPLTVRRLLSLAIWWLMVLLLLYTWSHSASFLCQALQNWGQIFILF